LEAEAWGEGRADDGGDSWCPRHGYRERGGPRGRWEMGETMACGAEEVSVTTMGGATQS
jgi:hypothetical protein